MTTSRTSPTSSLPFKITVPLKVIAIGDSIIYGYGDHLGGGWVERLRCQWMSANSQGNILYNLGVRGDRTKNVLHRLEHEYSVRGELRNNYPDLLILSVGVNDSARLGRPKGKLFTLEEEFQKEVETLLEVAQRLCKVVFVGMIPVDEAKMPFLDCLYYNHADQYHYKEITRQACLNRNIPYLDIFQNWQNQGENWIRSKLSPDGLHPNIEGYQAILDAVTNWKPIKDL